jgi:hypothetical protein
MRLDNLPRALAAQLGFAAVGAAVLLGWGRAVGTVSIPSTFWLALALYPVWGTAQQFALQNLVARNLRGMLPDGLPVALVSAALFGAAHYPRLELTLLTFLAGFFFTWIYRRLPNLWAVGIAHGLLGALAFYIVLGEDPGAKILEWLSR